MPSSKKRLNKKKQYAATVRAPEDVVECIINGNAFTLRKTRMSNVPDNVSCFSSVTPFLSVSRTDNFSFIFPSFMLDTTVDKQWFSCMEEVGRHNVIFLPLSKHLAAHIYTTNIPQEYINKDPTLIGRIGVDCIVAFVTSG